MKGGGFPETTKGRIGLAIAQSDSKVMYALVEADTNPNPKGKAGVGKPQASPSGLYRSADGGATWARTNVSNTRPFYYSQVRVDTRNPDRVYWSSTPVMVSSDGGKTTGTTTNSVHVDHHAMWIDPNDPNRIIVGNDGGVAESFDRGGNWLVLNSLAISQLYAVSFDYAFPYNVCGGLQDNGSWCGPSRRKSGPISNAMWYTVAGGDGFWTAQDPTDPHIVYAESQGGSMSRINVATGENRNLVQAERPDSHRGDAGLHRRRSSSMPHARPVRRARSGSPNSRPLSQRTRRPSHSVGTGRRRSSSRRTIRGRSMPAPTA